MTENYRENLSEVIQNTLKYWPFTELKLDIGWDDPSRIIRSDDNVKWPKLIGEHPGDWDEDN